MRLDLLRSQGALQDHEFIETTVEAADRIADLFRDSPVADFGATKAEFGNIGSLVFLDDLSVNICLLYTSDAADD